MTVLEAIDITKSFYSAGDHLTALNNLNLAIDHGSYCCLFGSSGSGKTTLLNILAGQLQPTSGEILLNGIPLHKMKDRQLSGIRGDKVGVVYQQFNLIPRQTVYENIRAPLLFGNHSIKDEKKAILETLDRVGLKDKAQAYPLQLSGGQLQRAAIARAVIKKPEILLADEPTGNLDKNNGLEIIALFKELHKQGNTILVVSHDERFQKSAQRNLKLEYGEIVSDKKRRTAAPKNTKKKSGNNSDLKSTRKRNKK